MTKVPSQRQWLGMMLLACMVNQTRASDRFDELRQRLDQGGFDQAMASAEQQREQFEGLEAFDALYGQAALESGRVDEALFVFERLTLISPDNPVYRFHLARCYLLTGNPELAAPLFEQTLADQPPEPVAAASKTYLQQIQSGQNQLPHGRWNLRLQSAIGYDTNINSATTTRVFEIPDSSLLVSLNEKQRAIESGYYRYLASLGWQQAINHQQLWQVGFSADRKDNAADDRYDLDSLSLAGGWLVQGEHQQSLVKLEARHYWQGRQAIQEIYRLNGYWQWQGWQTWRPHIAGWFGSRNDLRNDRLDNLQGEIRTGLQWLGSQHSARLHVSQSSDLDNPSDVSRDSLGIDLGAGWTIAPGWQLDLAYSGRHYRFQQALPATHLFAPATVRDEYLHQSTISSRYQMFKWLALSASVSYQRYLSNVDIYEYQRVTSEAGIQILLDGR